MMSDAKKEPDVGERLHKFLASTGAGSRRECETFIKQGRVSVNGKTVTKMGVKVVPGEDAVLFDGEKVQPERKVYWLLNKPTGYICTNSDERGRPRAMDLIPDKRQRVYTVGRLDADSQGLILITNDGTIANIICHPRYRVEKVYEIVIRGRVTRYHGTRIEAGVWLAEGKSSPAKIEFLDFDQRKDETRLQMTLFEGRNREIRRMFAKVGLKVKRLLRTRIGPLELGTTRPGESVALSPADLRFVNEAERLYQANKEIWDAELPQRRPGGPRRSGGGKGGFRGNRGAGGSPRGGAKGGPRGIGRGGARTGGARGGSGRGQGGARGSTGRQSGDSGNRGPSRSSDRPSRPSDRPARSSDRPKRRGRRYYP